MQTFFVIVNINQNGNHSLYGVRNTLDFIDKKLRKIDGKLYQEVIEVGVHCEDIFQEAKRFETKEDAVDFIKKIKKTEDHENPLWVEGLKAVIEVDVVYNEYSKDI